jgi:hypothetical protein
MKYLLFTTAVTITSGAALAQAQEPSLKGPPKTMGDDSKLVATRSVGGAAPRIGPPTRYAVGSTATNATFTQSGPPRRWENGANL